MAPPSGSCAIRDILPRAQSTEHRPGFPGSFPGPGLLCLCFPPSPFPFIARPKWWSHLQWEGATTRSGSKHVEQQTSWEALDPQAQDPSPHPPFLTQVLVEGQVISREAFSREKCGPRSHKSQGSLVLPQGHTA
jgi:hypothetical protein